MIKLTRPLVCLDLETTGTSTSNDRIVQIAIIKTHVGGRKENRVELINPTIAIPKEASDVHGITDDMVSDKPTFSQVASSIFSMINGCDISGYNSDTFDIPLLANEFNRCGISFDDSNVNYLDVLKLERKLNSNKLSDTYTRYTGKSLDGAHDALVDTQATLDVLDGQLKRHGAVIKELIGSDEITVEGLDELCQGTNKRYDLSGKLYKKNNVVYWAFGKHRDKPVLSTLNYIQWVLDSDFPLDTKNKLKELL